MVQGVVLLPAERELHPLVHPEILEKRRVEIPVGRPVEGIADTLGVDSSGGWRSELRRPGSVRGFEEEVGIGRRAALRVLIGVLDRAVLHPILSAAAYADSGIIRAGRDREIRSARIGVNSVDRPAAEEF